MCAIVYPLGCYIFDERLRVSRTKDSPQGSLTKAISQTLNSNTSLLIQGSKQESSDAIKCECNVMMLWPSQGLYLSTTSSDVRKKGSQLRLLKEHQNSHIQTFQPNTKTEMSKKKKKVIYMEEKSTPEINASEIVLPCWYHTRHHYRAN